MAKCRTLVVGLYIPGIIRSAAYAFCNAMFYSGWTVTDRIVDLCDYQWQIRNKVSSNRRSCTVYACLGRRMGRRGQ